jgi:hypothetical protein
MGIARHSMVRVRLSNMRTSSISIHMISLQAMDGCTLAPPDHLTAGSVVTRGHYLL